MPTLIFPCDCAADAERILNEIKTRRENSVPDFELMVEQDSTGQPCQVVVHTSSPQTRVDRHSNR
jgi:hypothetical protein